MLHRTILVAIGANLPGVGGRTALATCEWAVGRLRGLAGLEMVGRSGWWRSAPVPPSGQPDYVNGVVVLRGEAEAGALLGALHGIEAEAGRVRGVVNGARTLDLDLLGMDGVVVDGGGVRVPHPRLHERGFVLAPLAEVAGGWVHPELGESVGAMLAGLPGGLVGIERMGGGAARVAGTGWAP